MNADSVKNALTRKLGPLPAWAWFLIAGAALWYYRQRTSANSADAAQADAANAANTPAYYGPYGQDNYPINSGAGGGFGAGTDTTGTGPASPPTINVNTGGNRDKRRTKKTKAQHKQKVHGKENLHELRSKASTHNGRKSRHGSGTVRQFHGGPVRYRAKPAPSQPKGGRTRKRR